MLRKNPNFLFLHQASGSPTAHFCLSFLFGYPLELQGGLCALHTGLCVSEHSKEEWGTTHQKLAALQPRGLWFGKNCIIIKESDLSAVT